MLDQKQKLSLLHEMGIETWQHHAQGAAPSFACYGYVMLNQDQHWQGACLAQQGAQPAQEQRLLQAIVAALGWSAQGQSYDQSPDLSDWCGRQGLWLLMGSAIAEQYANDLQGEVTVVTPSLSEMLQDPSLKRPTWNLLQAAMKGRG